MLKLARLLEQYRSAVLVLLMAPVLGLFLSSDFHLEMVPENPHLEFVLKYDVPARTAEEITLRAVEPSEKVLNGLPGLLGMESNVEDEKAEIHLRFNSQTKVNVAYLNIQEKMDRIRLILPRDVEKYTIDFVHHERPASLEFSNAKGMPLSRLAETLAPFQGAIQKTDPPIERQVKIIVEPDPRLLAINQISISQVVQALQSLGLTTSLGRRQGLLFETSNSFANIEQLRSALVGAVGHRPLRLSDVAQIRIEALEPAQVVSLWIDEKRGNLDEIIQRVEGAFPGTTTLGPNFEAIFSQSLQPILLIIICFLLQILVVPMRSMLYVFSTGLIVSVHFLFWKGLVAPPFTVMDLHALALTLMIGSLFLPVLYIRIRTYFMPNQVIPRPLKTLDQAKLFSLAELIPTFIVLCIALWIAALPILTTTVNLPSRFIAESFFYLGLPILFTALIVIPLSTHPDFLLQNIRTPKAKMFWNLSPLQAQVGVWSLVGLAAATLFLFHHFDFGVSYKIHDQLTRTMVKDLRGYSNQLVFKTQTLAEQELKDIGFEYADRNLFETVRVREFTPSGMRYLGQLDLMGFVSAMKGVQKGDSFGFIQESSQPPIPLEFSAGLLSADWIPGLYFANKKASKPSLPIETLTAAHLEQKASRIVRDNMVEGDRVRPSYDRSRGSFLTSLSSSVFPTPWTDYLLKQFREYQSTHWISLIFLFFLFAIYLNSFIRSAQVVLFALSTTGFVLLIRSLIPDAFHADSLWMLELGTFLALFQILVSSRIIDIERSRGFDRDLCIEAVKKEFAPTVFLCSGTFVLAILVGGLTEFFPFVPAMGFWKEGVVLAVLMGAILMYSAHILFSLFYLSSEEYLDRIIFRFYRAFTLWKRLRSKD